MYWFPWREILRMCLRASRILGKIMKAENKNKKSENIHEIWVLLNKNKHQFITVKKMFILFIPSNKIIIFNQSYIFLAEFIINFQPILCPKGSYLTLSISWMYCCSSQPTTAKSSLSSRWSSITGTHPSKNLVTNMPALQEGDTFAQNKLGMLRRMSNIWGRLKRLWGVGDSARPKWRWFTRLANYRRLCCEIYYSASELFLCKPTVWCTQTLLLNCIYTCRVWRNLMSFCTSGGILLCSFLM